MEDNTNTIKRFKLYRSPAFPALMNPSISPIKTKSPATAIAPCCVKSFYSEMNSRKFMKREDHSDSKDDGNDSGEPLEDSLEQDLSSEELYLDQGGVVLSEKGDD
jgi:hypothetical protein